MKNQLNSEYREFFFLVRKAALANPFSDERVEIDLKIAGLSRGISEHARIIRLTQEVHNRVSRLEEKGELRLDQFSGEERTLIETAFLFDKTVMLTSP